MNQVGRNRWGRFPFWGAFVAVWISVTSFGRAYTPDSPEVQRLVKRGAEFLRAKGDSGYPTGQMALASMALLKAGFPATDPMIQETLKDCTERAATAESAVKLLDIYETSVIGLLLCDTDPVKYKEPIANLIRSLEMRQKPHGGWGYENRDTGDTSMTQYVILFSWVARYSAGVEMSRNSIAKSCNWFLRTQDVSGAWGYQGQDPGVFRRTSQTEVRNSLCVAGLGSLYICSDFLGFTSLGSLAVLDEELPPALKPVLQNEANRQTAEVEGPRVRDAIRDGDRWYQANYTVDPPLYTTYYLYTLERFQSFREAAESRNASEPRWYNDGVNLLKSRQRSDGSWDLENGDGVYVDSAFSVLFLTRSAKKTIIKAKEDFGGALTAGRGLPSSAADVKLDQQGKIVRTPFQGTADALLAILESSDQADLDLVEPRPIPLSDFPEERSQQLRRMRKLVRAEDYGVRMIAVKTLSTSRELENVPALIHALTDPDLRIAGQADEGLRFVSRKLSGFGKVDDSSKNSREALVESWKTWYTSIRPDAEFSF